MEEVAWSSAGHEVNLQSPKQLGTVLFDEMKLTPTKKTKKGSYTTNAAALTALFAQSEEDRHVEEVLGTRLKCAALEFGVNQVAGEIGVEQCGARNPIGMAATPPPR
mgnify:CR=1 FL=1